MGEWKRAALRKSNFVNKKERKEELFSFFALSNDKRQEALSINLNRSDERSLFFRNVIQALAEGNRRHIPYRNSTLTRLLKDGLDGNSRTSLIVSEGLDCCDSGRFILKFLLTPLINNWISGRDFYQVIVDVDSARIMTITRGNREWWCNCFSINRVILNKASFRYVLS